MGFRLLPEVEAELDEIWFTLPARAAALRLPTASSTPSQTGWLLAKNPQIGRRREADLRPVLRSFPVGEYVIIYRIEGDDAIILHVMRGSRDIEALLSN